MTWPSRGDEITEKVECGELFDGENNCQWQCPFQHMGDNPSEAFPDQWTCLKGDDQEIADLVASVIESLVKRPEQTPLIRKELSRLVSTLTCPGEQEVLQEIRERLEELDLWSSLEKLTTLAVLLAEQLPGVESPNRDEKRKRPRLEQWFVNNWPLIKPHIGEIRVLDKTEEGEWIDITDEVKASRESSKSQ